jgi:hypothetical protein
MATVKLSNGDPIKVLGKTAALESGYTLVDSKPDHTGLLRIRRDSDGKEMTCHPRRVFPLDVQASDTSLPLVNTNNPPKVAKPPAKKESTQVQNETKEQATSVADQVAAEVDAAEPVAPAATQAAPVAEAAQPQVQSQAQPEAQPPSKPAAQPTATKKADKTEKPAKAAPVSADELIAAMTSKGELWSKQGAPLSDTIPVRSYTLVLPNNRYISFNTYAGSFGRKGKAPAVEDALAGKDGPGIYTYEDAEKLRAKLTKGGYSKH